MRHAGRVPHLASRASRLASDQPAKTLTLWPILMCQSRRIVSLLFTSIFSLAGCGTGSHLPEPSDQSNETVSTKGTIDSMPLATPPTGVASGRFELLNAERTGIDFLHAFNPPDHRKDQLRGAFTGSGVAIGDFDGDTRPDIFLTRQTGGGRLFRNLGDFRFQDVTDQAGLMVSEMWGTGASFVDIDNDGDLDLYVCGFDCANQMYINQGDGTFREQGQALGLDFHGASVMMAFADYDLDGDLDGYLLTNRILPGADSVSLPGASTTQVPGFRVRVNEEFREYLDVVHFPDGSYKIIHAGQYDHLYRNDGPGADGQFSFTDVSEKAGMKGTHYGLSASWWDYNQDGRPDLYVANDFFGPDRLYRNDGPDRQGVVGFTDVLADAIPHTPWFSMGTDISDIDNDGLMDLMGSDMAGANHYRDKMAMGNMSGPESDAWFLNFPHPPQYMRNTLCLNTGTGRFMEIAFLAGVAKTDWTWTIRFADLDNDGREDLFVTNGMSRDWFNGDLRDQTHQLTVEDDIFATQEATYKFWIKQPRLTLANIAMRNAGNYKFKDVSADWGLNLESVSYGAALGDLDNDGDLDLVINNFEEQASLYRNDLVTDRCLRLRLRGTVSNRWGIGSTVRLTGGTAGPQLRYVTAARGYMSASDPVVHFGVGQVETIDRLTIEWPSGHVQKFEQLATDHLYTVTEPSGQPHIAAASTVADAPAPMFAPVSPSATVAQ